MNNFLQLFIFNLKRRFKDGFVIGYNIIYPLIMILLLGYLSKKYYVGDDSFTSYMYYSIVVIPFCILSSMLTTAFIAREEKTYKTASRLIMAPVKFSSIVLCKILSSTVVLWTCTVVVTLILKLFKVELLTTLNLIIYLVEIFAVSTIGVFLGVAFKKFNLLKGILNLPLTIFALLGGVFFPVGFMGKITAVSPLTWINNALLDQYVGQSLYTGEVLAVLFAIGVIFTLWSIKSFRKEVLL